MNVHLNLHEAHFRFRAGDARFAADGPSVAHEVCTGQMHVHLSLLRMNVHPVLHLHDISGTI